MTVRYSCLVLLLLVRALMGQQIKIRLSILKLSSSIRDEAGKVTVNVFQCTRLADRIVGIAELYLKGQEFRRPIEPFLILLMRARSLIIECGKTEWLHTAFIRQSNKEAYAEVHRELTLFLNETTSKDEGGTDHLNEDAKHDLQNNLEKLEDLRRAADRDGRFWNRVFTRKNAGEQRKTQGKTHSNSKKHRRAQRNAGEQKGKANAGQAEAEPLMCDMWSLRFSKIKSTFSAIAVCKCSISESFQAMPVSELPSRSSNCKHKHVEKIIKVISEKSKDQASDHALSEQGSSVSYLQIPSCEINPKRRIGTGSYGDVYEAEWLGCKICVKDFPWPGKYGEQWLKQAMPLLKLRHPNVLQLVGISTSMVNCVQPKVLTETMEGDIRSLIDRRMEEQHGKGTPFNWYMTLYIMIQVIRGLAFMHQNGFMHGDRVLTTNIIIKVCGDFVDARIGDFGVPLDIPVEYTRVYELRKVDQYQVDQYQILETARWMAPEVCAGTAPFSTNSDIYSFGIFCFELLTGRIPFDNFTKDVYSEIMAGELRPELPDNLDVEVADIITRCWHTNPSLRPGAQEVADILEKIWTTKKAHATRSTATAEALQGSLGSDDRKFAGATGPRTGEIRS